jgi:hypothetical protein
MLREPHVGAREHDALAGRQPAQQTQRGVTAVRAPQWRALQRRDDRSQDLEHSVSNGARGGSPRPELAASEKPPNFGVQLSSNRVVASPRSARRLLAADAWSVRGTSVEAPIGRSHGGENLNEIGNFSSWRVVLEYGMRTGRAITTRVVREGHGSAPSDDWAGTTVAQRIDAVWELTQQCLLWNRSSSDELRLQRSHCRVQRPRR